MSGSIADEIAAVNHPEQLDTVLDHLRRQFHAPELALDGPPIRLGGGFWAEMWTLTFATPISGRLPARVVLRLAPDARLAAWETTFQAYGAAQGYPTPAIRASDLNPTNGRRAWCVMDHATGAPLLGGLSGLRALTERLIGVDGLLDHYRSRARDLGDPPLQRTVERFAATRPDPQLRVVCHGDLHPFNVLAFTHLLLANPPLDAPKPLRPIIGVAARRIANRFITTYRNIGPHPIEAETLDWYRNLQGCRILTDLAGWRDTDELDAHSGHPWLAMEAALQPLLAA